MKKGFWLLCGLVLATIMACQSSSKSATGLILYQTLDDEGLPRSELVVANVDGKELRRLRLPGTLGRRFPTRVSHRALFFTSEGDVYLVDGDAGSAQKLELPPEEGKMLSPNPSGFNLAGGKQWTVLASPPGDQGYLLDLQSGRLTDLKALDSDIQFILSGKFSPDDAYLALHGGLGIWLVPTSSPRDAERLEREVVGVDFSSDGKQMVYIQASKESEQWQFDVVIQEIKDKSEAVFTSDTFIRQAAFVPGKEQRLVLLEDDKLSLFDLRKRTRQELLAFQGHPESFWFGPNGEKLVFGHDSDETLIWHLVDLKGGTVQVLDDLTGYVVIGEDAPRRWMTFVDSAPLATNHCFISLDLESGETHQVLAFDEATRSFPFPQAGELSDDGRFRLVRGMLQDPNLTQLWLIDLEKAQARLLAEGRGVTGSLSPDGQWVAVGITEMQDERLQAELTLMATEGEQSVSLGEGYRPVWVRP